MVLDIPILINQLEIKNRIVMAPMATHKLKNGEKMNDDICDYYKERAIDGAVGLIETEYSYVNPVGRAGKTQVSVAEDGDINEIAKIADAVHSVGTSKVFIQLNHAGGYAKPFDEQCQNVAPSAIPYIIMGNQVIPHELTIDEIGLIVNDFAKAALRAKKAGFDGVEIHGAHGYLLNQFLSPITNKRKDIYGGKIENRVRIYLDILKEVRKEVGNDFPVSVRLGTLDGQENGISIEDVIVAAKMIEVNGTDLLSVSGGLMGYTRKGHNEPGYFKDISKVIKEVVDIPVMLTGGIKTGYEAEKLLQEDFADLIGIGRELMKDASWAIKQGLSNSATDS